MQEYISLLIGTSLLPYFDSLAFQLTKWTLRQLNTVTTTKAM